MALELVKGPESSTKRTILFWQVLTAFTLALHGALGRVLKQIETESEVKMAKKSTKFTKELVRLTIVSYEYAAAAWFTLEDWRRNKPIEAAIYYKRRFSL